ncbi:MAG: hypothetical protein ACT4PT_12585 [Methanobacteriota archaeon]
MLPPDPPPRDPRTPPAAPPPRVVRAVPPPRAPVPVSRSPPAAYPPPPPEWEEYPIEHKVSGTELVHLAAAAVALSLAFSFPLAETCFVQCSPTGVDWARYRAAVPWSFLIVVLGFVLHELAHKVLAQRYRMWAEFRSSITGLAVAIGASFSLGIVFAAPGAVYIVGDARRDQSGKISAVGPLTNLVIGFAFLAASAVWTIEAPAIGRGDVLEEVAYVNAFLSAFNLVPVRPLDGSKIVRWSVVTWLLLVAATVALFVGYLYGLDAFV